MPEVRRILPDPQRRGEIQFRLAKRLPYNVRLALIGILLVAGLSVQATVSLLAGAALLLAASLLAVVKGFSNLADEPEGPAEWRGGSREQLDSILTIARKIRQWDRSALDITCGAGCGALVAAIAVGIIVAFGLWMTDHDWLAAAWVLDAAALLLPHWVTGVRRILTNDPLAIKAEQLLNALRLWERDRREGESVTPQLLVRRGPKGEMPSDAKLVLQIDKLRDAFLGLQVQVVLNRVQGTDYPYLYCVLVARPSLRMPKRLERPRLDGVEQEVQHKPDEQVDVLVIRQQTLGNTGYHTGEAACRRIFLHALKLARKLASDAPGEAA